MNIWSVFAKENLPGTLVSELPRSPGFRAMSNIFEIVQPFNWGSSEFGPRALLLSVTKSCSSLRSSGTPCTVVRHADKRKCTEEQQQQQKNAPNKPGSAFLIKPLDTNSLNLGKRTRRMETISLGYPGQLDVFTDTLFVLPMPLEREI